MLKCAMEMQCQQEHRGEPSEMASFIAADVGLWPAMYTHRPIDHMCLRYARI